MIKALDLKMQQQEIFSMSLITRYGYCGGNKYPKKSAVHFYPDASDHIRQRVYIRAGDCFAQCPHPGQLQGDSDWNGGSEWAR